VGKDKRQGIIVGIIIVVVLAIVGFSFLDRYSDDARLAQLTATYFDDQDRLTIALILTNADGEFTKANGHIEIRIYKGSSLIHDNEYDFTKDDFVTWDNLFLGKQRGVWFTIHERFPGTSMWEERYTVYAELETKSGRYWELQTDFRSRE